MLNIRNGFAIALVVGTMSACSSDDNSTPFVSNALTWQACETAAALQCTEIKVPKDYAIDAEEITLSLIRKPANGNQRRGALLFNPGGPGGSGIELIETFAEHGSIPQSVTSAYDLVSFDPRGVGKSTEVDCQDFGLDDIEDYPTDGAAIGEMHAQFSEFSSACFQKYGTYLQQLGSLNVVRDMEEIRKALGEEKLNFIGYSYGTRLAALYLQKYPTTSGRIVLDASVHPDSAVDKLVKESLPALQTNLRLLLSQCTQTDPDCEVDQLLTRLANRANQLANDASAAAQEEFELFGEIVIAATQDPEFGLLAADTLIEYLNTLDRSVFDRFFALLQQFEYMSETTTGEETNDDGEEDEDNETAQIAILCADDAFRPSADSLISLLGEFNQISDVFAEAQIPLAGACAGWPAALEPLPPISTNTAPVSLVIGGTTDTQTPIAWSESMAQAIGGVYIRSEHLGHTAVFNDASDCIDTIVEKFLLDGLAPAATECPVEN